MVTKATIIIREIKEIKSCRFVVYHQVNEEMADLLDGTPRTGARRNDSGSNIAGTERPVSVVTTPPRDDKIKVCNNENIFCIA